jgi:ribonuclease E
LEKWTGSKDVWTEFRVDEQLVKALDRKVYLPSGGSLVIDRTEAMTVVDVNTGRFTGQGGNLEETVTANNLEAAEEIVRQLRLRDIGGIIVVDFIDMVLESNRDQVLRRLLECLGRDRTKHQVAEVTSLGLVQMTRKRIGQGLIEVFSTTCDHCNGRGINVSMEPIAEKRAALPPVVKHKDASKDVAKVAAASKRTASSSAVDSSDGAQAPASDNGSVSAQGSESTSVDSPAPADADSSAQSAPVVTPAEAAPVLEASPRGRKRRVATKPAGDPSIPVT